MKDMTIEKILAIKDPEQLFFSVSGKGVPSSGDVNKQYHDLCMLFHPDMCSDPRAKDAFNCLVHQRKIAYEKIKAGTWRVPGLLSVQTAKSTFEVRYKLSRRFDLGEMLIGKNILVYLFDKEFIDLYEHFKQMIARGPKYADQRMKDQYSRYIPQITFDDALIDGRRIVVCRKPKDVVALSDVVRVAGGKLDPAHVGWCVSRMLDISCWLKYCSIASYAITIDHLFVDVGTHTIFPYGIWLFSYFDGDLLKAAPSYTTKYAEKAAFHKFGARTVASVRANTSLTKVLGRQLLGDPSGAKIQWDKSIPKPMRDYLIHPSSESSFQEQMLWKKKVLPESFGPAKFVDLNVDIDKCYQE